MNSTTALSSPLRAGLTSLCHGCISSCNYFILRQSSQSTAWGKLLLTINYHSKQSQIMLKYLLLTFCLILGPVITNQLNAQSSDAVRAPLAEGSYYWKDLPVIFSIVENELKLTNTSLSRQNLNKTKAILEAYRTLLIQFQLRLNKSESPATAIESAFEYVKNEDVNIPYKRVLIVNDVFILKEDLISKITTIN